MEQNIKMSQTCQVFYWTDISTMFREFFSLTAHTDLSKIHDDTPQNIASLKGDKKLYMAISMYAHIINAYSVSVHAYESRT
jgi:hypothetical protein